MENDYNVTNHIHVRANFQTTYATILVCSGSI